ncbi:MAG: BamA/TamA family outer membrane protein [Candidatus Cloacimonetes bacterium]|nr:BamA/TamA family outer membrane protein [Candidatus Cloacimonadota bacterium]
MNSWQLSKLMFKNKFIILFFLLFIYNICPAELIVGEIFFEGNNFFSDKELQSAIQSGNGAIFDQKLLNEDAETIANMYHIRGYQNVKVHNPQIITKGTEEIDIVFRIEEMEKLKINNLILNGNRYISEKRILDAIDLKNLYLSDLDTVLKDIVEMYTLSSFLFASAEVDSLLKTDSSIDAFLKIHEGNFCEFHDFKFRGNKITTNKTLLKISQLEDIEKITPLILDQSSELIQKKKFIKSCKIIPLNHRQLLIEVEEDRMSLISGIAGYDNSKTSSNKLSGYLNLEFLNLYGTDRSLSLFWQRISADRNSIELNYHESGLQRFPVSGDFLVFREEVDSTFIRTKFDAEIYYYDLFNKYGVYMGMEDIFPGSKRPKIVEKTSFKKAGIFWEKNVTDYYLNPSSGSIFFLKYYYIFNRIENKNISKQAVELSFNHYFGISNNLVVATGANANVLENKALTAYEVFELGGSRNLRGFNENQFKGYRVFWSNLELRYLLSRNSRAFLFSDYGYVHNDENTFDKLFGFGFGLRVETRLGILRLDYGFSYFEDELRNPLDGIIHFGLETKL